MRFQKCVDVIIKSWRWCLRTVIAPVLRRTGGLMLRWAAAGTDRSGASDEWKQKAMHDFSAWLAAMPDAQPGGEPDVATCDLYTLLTEFAALRQEIKLQNRQQRTVIRDQEALADRFRSIGDHLEERIAHLGQVHDDIRGDIEVKAVLPFLDVRDALVRGETAARQIAKAGGFWRRAPKGMDAVVEGYAMGLRRFDRALNLLGVSPIATVDHLFDAGCMRAVAKRAVGDKTPGIVLEETLSGFLRNGEVLRTAEVIVNGK